MLVNFLAGQREEEEGKRVNAPQIPLDRIAVVILGGGKGTRLSPLTDSRCKPAISFGGRYSLIDVPISHSLSSGLTKIFVIGQYLTYSLQKHLFETYLNYGLRQNHIQLLVPEERNGEKIWYQGTADAVRKNQGYFDGVDADYFLILSGDQLYNINFQDMIQFAAKTDAGMVIAAQPVNQRDAHRMGLLKVEKGGSSLIDFYEKPDQQEILDRFYTDEFTLHTLGCTGSDGKNYLGSMGIYLFKKDVLFNLLKQDPRDDFGKHLITTQMKQKDVHTYIYSGYWEDIGTIDSYYHANLALAKKCTDPRKGLIWHDERNCIITKSTNLPGPQISDCRMHDTLICEGAIIEAAEVSNSVIGVRSVIGAGSIVRDSILMGNEHYHHIGSELNLQAEIGEKSVISRAIIDENVVIGKGVRLTNEAGHTHFDTPDGRISVRDGITIVQKGVHIPDHYTF